MRKLLILILLIAPAASAAPWPIRAAKAVGHQYVSMAHDCTHHIQFALECVAVLGSAAFDMQSTDRAVRAGLEEGNPLVYGLIGRRPSAHKLAIYGGVTATLELAGLDYLYENRDVSPKGPWDVVFAGGYTGLHVWAGVHNNNLANACHQAKLTCR